MALILMIKGEIEMNYPTEKHRKYIANVISNNTIDEEFYDRLVEEITSEYGLTEDEHNVFSTGFMSGFIYCLSGIQEIFKSKMEGIK